MPKHPTPLLAALAAMLVAGSVLPGTGGRADEPERVVREIYVPFEQLDVLLEDQPQRVLLSRKEYEQLLEKAKVAPDTRAPQADVLISADYEADIEPDRARITGTLLVEVLEEGLQAVELDLSGVGLRRAAIDGQSAALGRADDGPLTLFIEGKGRHELVLEMVAPVQTTAATQVLNVRLPRPPTATLELTVPGDVEVKSGADVAGRVFDEAAGVTRFELLPRKGDMTLVMTLNSRLLRTQRAVVARSVVVDEVTEAYERLHATVSMEVLHRAVEGFRFVVPEGFEVTDVGSPMLARWAVEEEGPRRVLDVRLREQTTDTVVLSLSAVRTAPPPEAWTLAKLQPLDVLGQVAVVGLLLDERLRAESVAPAGLIPIDTTVLNEALPKTVFEAEPGAPTLRSVVAYYAPQAEFDLAARFVRPPAEMSVMTNVLLLLGPRDQQVRGELFLTPKAEKLFGFDFSVPAAWHVTSVSTPDGKPLAFERYGPVGEPGRIHVRLPQGVLPGEEHRVYFNAASTPPDWLGDWETTEVEVPVFAVARAVEDVGAIAVEAPDGEMQIRLLEQQNLMPLDAAERQQYGLEEPGTTGRVLAYRYDAQPYQATLEVKRTEPRLTAKTVSFLRVESSALDAYYEVIFQIDEARAKQLSLLLPEDTPADVSIEALDGVRLKQSSSSKVDGMRRWTALLEEPRRDTVRLAVDFRQPLPEHESLAPEQELDDFPLPLIQADGVTYQSGLVAVEGDSELEVQVSTDARRVDVGELAVAQRQPGRGLLGVFGFVGDPPEVKVDVFRRPGHPLHPTLAERAELITRLSAAGESVTVARFDLRTKAVYLEVELPPKAELWAADLDRKPIKPQREGDHLLVSLPSASGEAARALRLVYGLQVDAVAAIDRAVIPAPKLRLRADAETKGVEVPVADFVWHLYPPPGYVITRSDGTVTCQIEAPEPAIFTVAKGVGAVILCPNPFFWFAARSQLAADFEGEAVPSLYFTEAPLPAAEATTAAVDVEFDEARRRAVEAAEPAGIEMTEAEEAVPTEAPMEEEREADADQPFDAFGRPAVVVDRSASMAVPEAPSPPPVPAQQPAPPAAAPNIPPPSLRRLEGFRSLPIDLEVAPDGARRVTLQSLGVDPHVEVKLVDRSPLEGVAWALALAVAVLGLALTKRDVGAKSRFVVMVIVVGSLVPPVSGWEETVGPANAAVFAAFLLIPYFLLAGCVRWFAGLFRGPNATQVAVAGATGALLIAVCLAPCATAAEPPAKRGPYVIQVVEPPEPVKVPEDAIILPYDPESDTGIQDADRLLVPYPKYVELWNLAYPDQKIQVEEPPAPFGLAGGSYKTRLEGDDYLLLEGRLEIDVFTEEPVAVPLGLAGGVLARAELDGKPARLSVPQAVAPGAQPQPAPQQARQQKADAPNQPAVPDRPFVLLHVTGEGRHQLDVAVRLRLERRGGWRVAEGALPAAPASSLAITVPQAETDVRLGQVLDRASCETEQADELIETALGARGAVSIQWRPQVAEGQVDRSLTARSSAVLDVQEDGLRLVWQLTLEFRRTQRDEFSVRVPGGYLVEKVEGTNVRGWEVGQEEGLQTLDVTLLKAAKDSEGFTVHLWRAAPVGQGDFAQFDVPVITVPDAALHNGRLIIRRSPLLDLRTVDQSGAMRTDLSGDAGQAPGAGGEESPLGIRPYEAYAFAATPFTVRLAALPLAGKVSAELHTVLKIAEFERSLETQVNLTVEDRAVYQVDVLLPDELDLEDVSAPGDFQWALTRRDDRPLLSVYLASGQRGQVPIRITGTLARQGATAPLPLPNIEVLGVAEQTGQIAVQVDPAFDVAPVGLEHCKKAQLDDVYGWVNPQHHEVTQLAIAYDRPDYQGTLEFSLRQPDVACETITNVRVTDRAIEETILLDFTIEEAGIREVEFLLPDWMEESRIQVPMLREQTVEPIDAREGSPVRVHLALQDDVMGELRVLVVNDRVLSAEPQSAPIPVVRTGDTLNRIVALQSAGRDEVVVDDRQLAGLEPLRRREGKWERLRDVLGSVTEAYLVDRDAEDPRLVFRVVERKAVETSGARIGLAETNLVVDRNGAYRAEQVYRIANTTEQFLDVQLPEGAELWTALVAGQPAKPTEVPGATKPRLVRIPLVKTAPGDLDYAVVLKYGGKMPALGTFRRARTRAQFPLVRVERIRVELSQVRLYLPETYRWFDFAGTMGLVADEQQLTAGFVAYQTKVTERLMETMRGANPYAQERAVNNLKQVGLALHGYHDVWSTQTDSEALQREYRKNYEVLQQAEQQAEQLEEISAGEIRFDNRFQLNARFEGQKTTRARNVVQDLGPNWDPAAEEQRPEEAGKPSAFNREWLIGNDLVVPSEVKADEKAHKELTDVERLPSRAGGKARVIMGKQAQPEQQQQQQQRFRGTRFQEGKAPAKGKPSTGGGKEEADRQGPPRDAPDGGFGYGEGQRDGQALTGSSVSRGGRRPVAVVGDAFAVPAASASGEELRRHRTVGSVTLELFEPGGDEYAGVARAPAGPGTGLPAGLASLDVQLPMRGTVYRFTTPGGDVEITARAVPSKLVDNLVRTVAVLGAVIVLLLVVRAARGAFRVLTRRLGLACLALLLGLFIAILFPVLGLAVIGAAVAAIVIGIKVRRASSRPSTP